MKALREHLSFVGLLAVGPLVAAGFFAAFLAILAIAHALMPFVFMGFMGWFLWQILGHGPRERERRREAIKEEQQRTHLLIQSYLAAHRLQDTPQNRWHVLQLLSKPDARRSGR